MNDTSANHESRVSAAVSTGKDLVSLLRDSMLFLLALLLIAFPNRFNSILVSAGFEEGSIVGFKWKSSLIEADKALKQARETIADLQGTNGELVKALTEANAKLKDPALAERSVKLVEENRNATNSAQQVQSTVSEVIASNSPLVEKAQSSQRPAGTPRAKSDYSVGLQTLGVPDSERVALNEKLKANGYGLDPVTWSYPSGQRPTWFADRSTVFYYAASSLPEARELAQLMKSLTGQEFAVQRGAGLGVDPALRDVTLFVHYVKT